MRYRLPLLAAAVLLGLSLSPAGAGSPGQVAPVLGTFGLSDKSVMIVWEDNNGGETGYQALISRNPAGPFGNPVDLPQLPGTGGRLIAQYNGLRKNTTYHLIVRTLDPDGNADTAVQSQATLGKGQNLIKSLFPTKLDFESSVGANDSELVTVENPFPFPLQVQVVTPVAAPFSVTPPGNQEIAAEGELDYLCEFDPTVAGKKTDKLKLTVSTPIQGTPVTVKFIGKGT